MPAGQAAVQGLRVDVQGAVEFLAISLGAPLQVAQEVTEPHAQGCLGVPELGAEGPQRNPRLEEAGPKVAVLSEGGGGAPGSAPSLLHPQLPRGRVTLPGCSKHPREVVTVNHGLLA